MYSDGSSATCYPTLNLKEENHLRQLFLGQDYSKSQLTEEQVCRILSRLQPSMKQQLKIKVILPLLSQRAVLIDTEMDHLEKTQSPEQAIRLVEFLMNKGTSGIEMLYLCLLESSEQARGVPCHYQLARELKKIVQAEFGINISVSSDLTAVSSTHQQQQSLQTRVKKLFQIPLDPETAKTLTTNLGLSASDFRTPPTSFQAICQCWLSQRCAPGDLDQLVEALVSTRGLGRHTSYLCSPALAASLEVRNFLLSLGERWVELAGFLGFSGEEVGAITEAHASNTEQQVVEFLKLWQLPECGQRTLPLMHKLKALAGIVEPRNTSRGNRPGASLPSASTVVQPLQSSGSGEPYDSVQPQQQQGASGVFSAIATSTSASPGSSRSATPVGVLEGQGSTSEIKSATPSESGATPPHSSHSASSEHMLEGQGSTSEMPSATPSESGATPPHSSHSASPEHMLLVPGSLNCTMACQNVVGASPMLTTAATPYAVGECSIIICDFEWDEMRRKELFPPDLVNDSDISPEVHQKALTEMYDDLTDLDIESLVPYMKKRRIISKDMEWNLCSPVIPPTQKLHLLMCDLKGPGKKMAESVFLCLLDCHEGFHKHTVVPFTLANVLKRAALSVSSVSLERQQQYARQHECIENSMKMIQSDMVITQETAAELTKCLGLEKEIVSGENSVVAILECWRKHRPNGTLEDLVHALLSAKGLGRLVSGLFPTSSSNPLVVHSMVHDLKENWKEFAFHLGFSDKEIGSITAQYPSTAQQIRMFLRVFRMPDLKQRTEFILHDVLECNNLHPPRHLELEVDKQSQAQNMGVPAQNVYINYFEKCVFSSPPRSESTNTTPQWPPLQNVSVGPLEDQPVPFGSLPTSDAESDRMSVLDSEPDSHEQLPEKNIQERYFRVAFDNKQPPSLEHISGEGESQKRPEDKDHKSSLSSTNSNGIQAPSIIVYDLIVFKVPMSEDSSKRTEQKVYKKSNKEVIRAMQDILEEIMNINTPPALLEVVPSQLPRTETPAQTGRTVLHFAAQLQSKARADTNIQTEAIASERRVEIQTPVSQATERTSSGSTTEIQGTQDTRYELILCYPTNQMPLQESWVVAIAVAALQQLNSTMRSATDLCQKLRSDYPHLRFATKNKLPVRLAGERVGIKPVASNGFAVVPLEVPEGRNRFKKSEWYSCSQYHSN